jgi:glycine cleavage system regulatory protein
MKKENLVITIFAEDRAGIVQELSETILSHGGNWQESSLSRLSGQFAGIANIVVDQDRSKELQAALGSLSESGISVTSQMPFQAAIEGEPRQTVELMVEANDRPGIVEEFASALADANVNVDQMETVCESASMAGYQLFIAHLMVALPDGFTIPQLEGVLEDISADVMVSILD